MNDDNPYAPPKAKLTNFEEDFGFGYVELAGRWTRFVAAFVDGLIGIVYAFPIIFLLGIWDYISKGQNPPFLLLVASAVLGFLGFLLIHGYFLKTNGQTVGKKLTKIRISDLQGNVPDFTKVILVRYLPLSLVQLIPMVGTYLPLLDVLFIFRGDRRCIHDLLAGTKVVKVTNPR
jgi:uncharacterized RDD family membrane protein YckC